MTKTAVLIATTEGPSAVQCITAEDPDVNSVFCLDRKAIPLEISNEYDAFVRRPTGVVEACFGHGAYRIDVSRRIACGLSWQLGTFIAHALADAGKLAGPTQKFSRVVWASGEVDRALRVGGVNDIGRKLKKSRAAFDALRKEQRDILVVVPAANAEEARTALREIDFAEPDHIRLLAVNSVDDVLLSLRLPRQKRSRLWPRKSNARRPAGRAVRWFAAAGFGMVAVSLATAMVWVGSHGKLSQIVPRMEVFIAKYSDDADRREPGIVASIIESRPPDGATCATVHFGLASPLVAERSLSEKDDAPPIFAKNLCDLRYRITNRLKDAQTLWVIAARDAVGGGRFRTRTVQQARSLAGAESLDIDARPPRNLKHSLKQALVILAMPTDKLDRNSAVGTALKHLAAVKSQSEFALSVKEVGRKGVAVYRIEHVFRPQDPK